VAFLFLYQRVGRSAQEVVNRILRSLARGLNRHKENRNSPKRNAKTPDSLALEAVGLGSTSPVPHTAASPILHILGGRSDECIGVGGIDLVARLANDIAVEVAHRLSERNSADDEGDEEHGVNAGHNEESEVGEGVIVANADHDVESCDAGLGMSVMVWERVAEHVPR
jgi:hypothetical protein